jgi:plasmid stabilization system protein ParE
MQQEFQGFGWIPHPVGRRWSHWLAHLLQGLQHPVHHFRRRGPPRARRVRSMLEVVLTRLSRQPECLRLEVYYEDVEPRVLVVYIFCHNAPDAAISIGSVPDCAAAPRVAQEIGQNRPVTILIITWINLSRKRNLVYLLIVYMQRIFKHVVKSRLRYMSQARCNNSRYLDYNLSLELYSLRIILLLYFSPNGVSFCSWRILNVSTDKSHGKKKSE